MSHSWWANCCIKAMGLNTGANQYTGPAYSAKAYFYNGWHRRLLLKLDKQTRSHLPASSCNEQGLLHPTPNASFAARNGR